MENGKVKNVYKYRKYSADYLSSEEKKEMGYTIVYEFIVQIGEPFDEVNKVENDNGRYYPY